MEQAIIETGLQVVATLLTVLIGVLGTWLTLKLAKKQQLQNIERATYQVMNAAQTTVGELQQTVVEALKKESGKLTREQIEMLGQQLLNKTYEKLSAPALDLLDAAAVDVQALIQGAAEDMINRMKSAA